MLKDGELTQEDYVWHEEMTDWLPIAEVDVLAPWIQRPQVDVSVDRVAEPSVATAVIAPGAEKSALATASMILGILGVTILWGIAAIPAIVLGHLALGDINRTQREGRGHAVTGLALGYTALGITVLGLLVYSLTR